MIARVKSVSESRNQSIELIVNNVTSKLDAVFSDGITNATRV